MKCPSKNHGKKDLSIEKYLHEIIYYNSNNYVCEIWNKKQKYHLSENLNIVIIASYECIKNHNYNHLFIVMNIILNTLNIIIKNILIIVCLVIKIYIVNVIKLANIKVKF